MAGNYIPFDIEYRDIDGEWYTYSDNETLTYYTLSSNPIELRVNFLSETIKNMYLSEFNVSWYVGDFVSIKTPKLKYRYTKPGNKKIYVYIARSDGQVISRGKFGVRRPVKIKVKNFLETNVKVSAEGDNVQEAVENVPAGIPSNKYGLLMATTGETTSEIKIYTQHTWQLYDETTNKYTVSMYADQAGKEFVYQNTIDGQDIYVTANRSAPLKTSNFLKNKYAQFQKTWSFSIDRLGTNPIDSIQIPPKKIYARKIPHEELGVDPGFELCSESAIGAEFVGTSGEGTVYYTDDSPTFVDDNGCDHVYRLLFQLDTTNWPDYSTGTQTDTASIKDSDNYTETPQHYQAAQDMILIDIKPRTPTKIKFTPTGINYHKIARNKFENTTIPFVMSLTDDSEIIIKDYPGIRPVSVNLRMNSLDNLAPNVYHVGLSSVDDNTFLNSDSFTISVDNDLSAKRINTYSSFGGTVYSQQSIQNITLVGALSTTTTGLITGHSDIFDIHKDTGKNIFFKFGEEIDYGKVINASILQENINKNDRLASVFNAVFGNFNDLPTSLGKTIYEKIRNFTANNCDISTCGVSVIYSLAAEVNHTLENYNFSYPGGIKRIVDNLSIGIKSIIGGRNNYVDDFDSIPISTEDGTVRYGRNLGKKLDVMSYIVSAGNPIVVREIYGNAYTKITPSIVPYLTIDERDEQKYLTNNVYHPVEFKELHYTTFQNFNGLSSYPLSSYGSHWNWGLSYPKRNMFYDYYDFFEYIPNTMYSLSSFDQNFGMINWDATNDLSKDRDTLSVTLTSYDNWYGDNGIITTTLEHGLRKGLGIL